MKTTYVSLKQNQKLNEDLRNLLLNFPKPLLLLDQKNKEVVLANKEAFKLLSVDENKNILEIQNKLSQKILDPYNYIEGLGDTNFEEQQSEQISSKSPITEQESAQQKYNLYEAIEKDQKDACFLIKTTHNFETGIPHQQNKQSNNLNAANQPKILEINGDQQIQVQDVDHIGVDYEANNNYKNENLNQHSILNHNDRNQPFIYSEIVNLMLQDMHFLNKELRLVLFHRITSFVKYEKLKMENNFYEMITATVSHDMRTPINSITGLLDSLEHFIQKSEGKKLIQVIRNSSKILLFLVNDILDFFMLKNGKFKSSLQEADPRNCLNEMIDMFELVASEKKIEMKAEFDPNMPEKLYFDEQRLKQVLINLITNALKFTLKGQITLSISYDFVDHFLNIRVSDTGIGVKADDEKKLFKLFGKLDAEQQINTKGIGLGLNICKKVVEACGGEIYLEPDQEEGACFCFNLKAYQDKKQISRREFQINFDESNHESIHNISKSLNQENLDLIEKCENSHQIFQSFMLSMDQSSDRIDFEPYLSSRSLLPRQQDTTDELPIEQAICPCQSRPQILIVDDNIFNIITLQTILEMQFSQRVEKATNGLEGLEKIQERIQQESLQPCLCGKNNKNYKIVFMDCNMPIMDGFEATEAIRKLQNIEQEGLKIIALTANTNKSFKTKCFQSGMDQFMTKPVSAEQLRQILIQQGLLP
eukprot:403336673